MIEVILLERIERLGTLGQTVKVKPGFARNFLLPRKKALRATKANTELFEKQRAELEARNVAMRAEAETAGKKVDGIRIIIIRQASETAQLYGSVSARDVADAAKEAGHTIDRNQVQIDTPIKELGLFAVKVKLHPEVMVKITVNVARSVEEAAMQVDKSVAKAKSDAAQAKADAEVAMVEAIGTSPVAEAAAPDAEGAEASDAAEPKKAKKPRAKKASAE